MPAVLGECDSRDVLCRVLAQENHRRGQVLGPPQGPGGDLAQQRLPAFGGVPVAPGCLLGARRDRVDRDPGLGDWLDPDAPPDDPADAKTDKDLVATAYFGWSARKLAAMAAVLGRDDDAAEYGRMADEVRDAFARRYSAGDGRLTSDAATAYALAIVFDLAPGAAARKAYGDRLAELAAAAGYRVSTGFVGTPLIADALSSTGHTAAAYQLLCARDCPSWLYPVLGTVGQPAARRHGQPGPDDLVQPLRAWLGGGLDAPGGGGSGPGRPGLPRDLVPATPRRRAHQRRRRHESPYGRVSIAWRLSDGQLEVTTEVPTGATAVLDLPGQPQRPLGPGRHTQRSRWSQVRTRPRSR